MSLGAFSISLAVKDLAASIKFYETLGFESFHDGSEHNYAILKSGEAVIGLFQGMFEGNILTINPGWTQDAAAVDGPFEDVRDIQNRLQAAGIDIPTPADANGTGPASFMLADPDGNTILFDQHVGKPDA
ncbi:VOC family protein [Cognatishimia sp.]|uniref:VOC family protein n=1 Tax=Cognatishimia sp. TaxID=2211648 RepID=UPI003514A024|nr:VOC family protein [Cognatishimia sp.]